jgi:hypothetical protein
MAHPPALPATPDRHLAFEQRSQALHLDQPRATDLGALQRAGGNEALNLRKRQARQHGRFVISHSDSFGERQRASQVRLLCSY